MPPTGETRRSRGVLPLVLPARAHHSPELGVVARTLCKLYTSRIGRRPQALVRGGSGADHVHALRYCGGWE